MSDTRLGSETAYKVRPTPARPPPDEVGKLPHRKSLSGLAEDQPENPPPRAEGIPRLHGKNGSRMADALMMQGLLSPFRLSPLSG